MKRIISFLPVLFVTGLILLGASCSTLANITSVGAQIAGATGIIDSDLASSISKSSDAIGKAAEEITPEQEYYIGRAVAANIAVQYKPYTGDPVLTVYLNKICNAITVNSPQPDLYNGYHVMILDSTEINAFATSGGHIFVTRGLIGSTDSEDALAAVIAHEIAHIQLQHSIKAIKTSRITQALMVTGTSAVSYAAQGTTLGELTDIFDESVTEIVGTLVNNGYSQSQEYDADDLAMSLMASAGYYPASLIDMLKLLEESQKKSSGGFNKTHPTPAKRISNAEKSVGSYSVQDVRSVRTIRFKEIMKL